MVVNVFMLNFCCILLLMYDGMCGLCNVCVWLLLCIDKVGMLWFVLF